MKRDRTLAILLGGFLFYTITGILEVKAGAPQLSPLEFPLADACIKNDRQQVESLISRGADLGLVDLESLLHCVGGDTPRLYQYLFDQLSRKSQKDRTYGDVWQVLRRCETGPGRSKEEPKEFYRSIKKDTMVLFSLGIHPNEKGSYGRTALGEAAGYCPESIIRALLEAGAQVSSSDNDGNTPLIMASENNTKNVVRLLLKNKSNPNMHNRKGDTSLILASKTNTYHVVKMLLEAGADVNSANKSGMTALINASGSGEESIVEELLRRGVSVNAITSYGVSALISAALVNHEPIVRRLIQAGADINIKDNLGRTPMSIAVQRDNPGVMGLLVKNGGNMITKGMLDWHTSLIKGNVSGVKFWLQHNPDITLKNEFGESILHWQSVFNNDGMLLALLGSGIDISARSKNGKTVLERYLRKRKRNHKVLLKIIQDALRAPKQKYNSVLSTYVKSDHPIPSVVKSIIKSYPSAVNQKDKAGQTPLMTLLKNYHRQMYYDVVVKLLLESGARTDIPDADGNTALSIAPIRSIDLLVNYGADINATDAQGNTLLMQRILHPGGHRDTINILISAGTDLNRGNNKKQLPLLYALRQNTTQLAGILIRADANVSVIGEDGKTAMDLALEYGDVDTVMAILDKGPVLSQDNKQQIEQLLRSKIKRYGDTLFNFYMNFGLVKELRTILDAFPNLYPPGELDRALYRFIEKGRLNLEVVDLLVEYGADINTKNADGDNLIIYAIKKRREDMLKLFLRVGVDPGFLPRDNKKIAKITKNSGRYLSAANVKEILKIYMPKWTKSFEKCQRETIDRSKQLIVQDDKIVLDSATNLIWKRCAEGQKGASCQGSARVRTYRHAMDGGKALDSGDESDWRLPSSKELESLMIKDCRTGKYMLDKKAFPSAPLSVHWVSDPPVRRGHGATLEVKPGYKREYPEYGLYNGRYVKTWNDK